MTPVTFYFDFISPYSYLALAQGRAFEAEHGVRFDLRPVVYAKILEATGLVGPVEIEAKRRYTFADVVRSAHSTGVPLVGPPIHPFRSLEALRAITLWRDDPRALDLAAALSSAAWGEGRDLADPRVVADVVARAGFEATGLAERIAAPEVKDALARATASALAAGVFGVPTFVASGEMFWGHDRMSHLVAFIRGELPAAGDAAARLLARPRGVERRR